MRRLKQTLILFLFLSVSGIGLIYLWAFRDIPSIEDVPDSLHLPSIRYTDRHGALLYEAIDGGAGRHQPIRLDDISPYVLDALIATEDSNYYNHPGVDVVGITRALYYNIRGQDVLVGGSTITQQLVRNLLLSEEERQARNLRRKVREAWLAWRLERNYTKDEILALYLNQIYFGGFAYGIEGAAQTYFGQPASDLTLAQSALLAGLPQSPGSYNPLVNPEGAKGRQTVVLGLMLKNQMISDEAHALALQEPLQYRSRPYPILAPHFVQMLQAEVDQLIRDGELDVIPTEGLIVRSTLDLNYQMIGEEIVQEQLSALDQPPGGGYSHNVGNGALVAIDPTSGDILTLVGSNGFFEAEIAGSINMALSPRQPGSTLKPIFYAAGMDPGRPTPFTPATMFLDVETTFRTREGEPYVPVNFSRTVHGPILLREALASSLNIPAVQALDMLGMDTGLNILSRLGIATGQSGLDVDLSMALGGGEVRLIDLTNAYGALANRGDLVPYRMILEIETYSGEPLFAAPSPLGQTVFDERVAWLVSDILSDDTARHLSFGPNSVLQIDRPAAVKTGTTNDFRDNWTIGYTPELVAGVWIGNSDLEPMIDVTGVSGAGPIWHQFMRRVSSGPAKPFERPAGLVEQEICTLSGQLPGAACPYTRLEWFIEGTEPTEEDEMYRWVTIDRTTGLEATSMSAPENSETMLALNLPEAAHGWARGGGIPLVQDLEPVLTGANQKSSDANDAETDQLFIQLVTPLPDSVYLYSSELPPENQRIAIEVQSNINFETLDIRLNGRSLAEFESPPFVTFWPIELGRSEIIASGVNQNGEVIESEPIMIEVILPEPEFVPQDE